jgi:hypothetical protein
MGNRTALPLELRLKMLDAVLDLMTRSGMSESTIRETFETCLVRLNERASNPAQEKDCALGIGNENICAELLRLWHRDERFIDREAKPRPLPLARGRNNLLSVIRRLDRTADAAEILREMRAVRLIRRTARGKYLPTSESAIVGQLHPLAIDHIAKLVVRLVSTVSRNLDQSNNSLRLIERHVYAPDLNWSEREAFAEFARQQGMAYLESVDNWLERRRLRRTAAQVRQSKKEVSASVHLFAYLGDDEGVDSLRAAGSDARPPRARSRTAPRTSRAKRSTPAREARA